MSPAHSRYVTACQQLLALGVVVVALAPATRVVSLDVVRVPPAAGTGVPTVAGPGVTLSVDAPAAWGVARAPRGDRGFGPVGS